MSRGAPNSTAAAGRAGEHAAAYLAGAGLTVVARNYRTQWSEIDLIAIDDRTLVFVEVKSWRTIGMEGLEHALDHRKRRRIGAAARSFLAQHPWYQDSPVRFDVVFVPPVSPVQHLRNAFEVPAQRGRP
jgi:putative endonuclease